MALGENLTTNALRLYPATGKVDKNREPRRRFTKAFRELLNYGGSKRMTADEYFDTKLVVILDMAKEALSSQTVVRHRCH
jgi:hypothetical protein